MPHVFIDDSGNPDLHNLKFPGSTKYLILTAVMVKDADIASFTHRGTLIKKRHFGNGEIKGSRIGKDRRRRNEILSDVRDLPFTFYSLVVDKKALIDESGVQKREELYAHCLIILLKRLFRSIGYYKAVVDEFGDSVFRKKFLSNKFINDKRTIFNELTVEFKSSISSIGVQIADIISNSIFSCYEHKNPLHTLAPIKIREYFTELWPPRPQKFADFKKIPSDSKWNLIVSKYSLGLAYDYIEQHASTEDRDVLARIETLRFLRVNALNNDMDFFVKSDVIIKIKNLAEFEVKESGSFMSKIIAPLRDAGVIIASSRDGYKLPTSTDDIDEFVEKVNGEVMPYLSRLQRARKGLMLITGNQYDAVNQEKALHLSKILRYIDSESMQLDNDY